MVYDVQEVVCYIQQYGINYLEVILMENGENVVYFQIVVDVVVVYYNVFIWFIDGFEFGYGVEIGISM